MKRNGKENDNEPEFTSSAEADMVAFHTPYIDQHEAATSYTRAGEGKHRRRRGFWSWLSGLFRRA